MTRRKWIRVQWPFEAPVLVERLRKSKFHDEARDGFIIDRVRSDSFEARFVEKIDVDETTIDPFGREIRYQATRFEQTKFAVSWDAFGLELVDPSRRIRHFINRLSEICDYSIALSPLSVDVTKWCSALEQRTEAALIVNNIQIAHLKINVDVEAKAVLTSTQDVRSASRVLADGRDHVIEKVRLRICSRPSTSLIMTIGGSATIIGLESEKLIANLRASLLEVCT